MNKNKKWLLALSVAGLITVNGIAMAAVSGQQDENGGPHSVFAQKGKTMKLACMREHKEEHTALLALLNMDAEAFKTEIKAGKTLAEIANEHGVSEQTLKDFMVQQMNKRIEERVAAGQITTDRAEKMKADMDDRITDRINGKGPMHGGRGMHNRESERGQRGMFNNADLLALLNMDAETLKTEMQAGKTLVAIANEHGVSEQALKDCLLAQMNKHLEEGIATGKISADQAEKMKANMEEHIANMINGKGFMHDGKGKGMMHKGSRPDKQETDHS